MTRRQAIAAGALQVVIGTAAVGLITGNPNWWFGVLFLAPITGAGMGWAMWEAFNPWFEKLKGEADDDMPPLP